MHWKLFLGTPCDVEVNGCRRALASHERIELPFFCNRRRWAVSRIDHGPIIQDQQLFPNRADDVFVGASPKVCSANAAMKESVASKEEARLAGQMKT
jgi:hypothetical protein